MLFGMLEINAYLLWRKFKPEQSDCSLDMFRRRLTHELLNNVIRRAELGEGTSLRGIPIHQHVPQKTSSRTRMGHHSKVCASIVLIELYGVVVVLHASLVWTRNNVSVVCMCAPSHKTPSVFITYGWS